MLKVVALVYKLLSPVHCFQCMRCAYGADAFVIYAMICLFVDTNNSDECCQFVWLFLL